MSPQPVSSCSCRAASPLQACGISPVTVAAYRYYSTLSTSDSNYISRPDGTSPPNLVALTNGEVEQRPGSKEDKALYQVCRPEAAVCNTP